MAFGFGFNKAKVLSSAEKFVQQGKLHNAIAEYEKIVEKDAKDLTVLNTIGDLYARLGQTDKAGEYFKRVGDTYAGDGFTVKAIAMYKKLTKLNPGGTEVVQRLAELYTQQGLYNDARQQYLQLADACIKSNDLTGAAKVFQKMLEIDPDNVSLQSKLADLYVKMGKKDEARDIFLRAATSLFERGSTEQADQALDRMLSLDPSNAAALLMRGKIAIDAGEGAAAVRYLEKVPNIDSKADGLQALLKAEILVGNQQGAEAVARKLASVHNDYTGIRTYADFLLAGGHAEDALRIYGEFADRLIVGDTGELVFALQGLTGQLKDDPVSLEKLRTVFQKAGATGNIPEVNELLAHAYVKSGELAQARDLYKELADLEPSNPTHMQNYRQVTTRLGEEPMARQLSPAEAKQAFFVEEIDAPPLEQEYDVALTDEINTVLAEAELFESYNKAAQAVAPLEGILARAQGDARINQRLVSVYQKLGRFDDAARCCDTLKEVYERFGMAPQSKQYGEMAGKFREQAGAAGIPKAVAAPFSGMTELPVSGVQEFNFSDAAAPAIPLDIGEAHEIDLSAEWEAAVEPAEAEPVASSPSASAPSAPSPSAAMPEFDVEAAELHPSVVADLLEEIRFYLDQSMWDEARSAISRCEQTAPATTELLELKHELQAKLAASTGQPEVVEVEVEAAAQEEEGTISEFDFESAETLPVGEVDTPPAEEAGTFEVGAPEPQPAEDVVAAMFEKPAPVEMEVAPPVPEFVPEPEVAAPPAVAQEVPAVEEIPEPAPPVEPEPVVAEAPIAEPEPVVLPPEPAIHEIPVPAAEPEPKPVPSPAPIPAVAAKKAVPIVPEIRIPAMAAKQDFLADMVLDLESALGDDFGVPEPKPVEAPPVMAAVAAAPIPSVAVAPAIQTITGSAPAPVAVQSAAPAAAEQPTISQAETSSVLSDLFEEFKEEVGEPEEEAEDPETHYSLGVAFKEMGLLDEAIGELQKVCKAVDRGAPFTQVMQAYTWLASCFVEKGVPEAGVKWYEKALTLPSSEDSRVALHYDLASAYEAAGEKAAALKHFTEVYGSNIDYRDVAQRIKALKS